MKLRVMCLPEEKEILEAKLKEIFDITQFSKAYQNRGNDKKVRYYIEAELLPDAKNNNASIPDELIIQFRLDDTGTSRMAYITANVDEAYNYWLFHDRTNGTTAEFKIKKDKSLDEYDFKDLIEYFQENDCNDI